MGNRLKQKMIGSVSYSPLTLSNNLYDTADINWEDSAGTFTEPKKIEDPSMNDYIKGYNMDSGRYKFEQWAKNNKNNKREAAKETVDISYTPKSLAKRILTLWRNNGPLQDFFDGFTSNQKMTNHMKQKIADILCRNGYEVVPTLLDETPRYASSNSRNILAFVDTAKKYIDEDDMVGLSSLLEEVFDNSQVIKRVAKEVKQLQKQEIKVDKDTTRGLMDYYNKIFPTDYSKSLVDKIFDKPKKYFYEFRDESIQDSTLNKMEQFNKGDQSYMSRKPNDGGIGGYNFPADFRGEGPGGVRPTMLETGPRMANTKKKRS